MAYFFCLVVEQTILAVKYRCLWQTVALRMIIFRRRDSLHKVRERLYFLLIFVVLGHPVRQPAARALKLTYCSIEMYWKGALPRAKMYPSWNACAFHAYFCFTWKGLLIYGTATYTTVPYVPLLALRYFDLVRLHTTKPIEAVFPYISNWLLPTRIGTSRHDSNWC